ncbi:hypothetical protein BJX65DRAFT_322254 [Aspergillus insuetus]
MVTLSRGLGRAVALAFSNHGATVVCADRDPSSQGRGQTTDNLIQSSGGKSFFVATDVTKAASVRERSRSRLTNSDALMQYSMVNNAGIAPEASEPCPVYETTEEVFDSTWQVNQGSIINLSSVLGVVGLSGTAAYAASKGAVVAFTRTVAMDYAPHGIHCNAILPGFTRTPLISSLTEEREVEKRLMDCHPMQRIGEPEEIANAAVFLASHYSMGMTGVNMSVDGGLHAQLRLK